MENTINLTQDLIKIGDASYTVKITVSNSADIEVIEFNYDRTNAIYPLYRSLLDVLTRYEKVHINLTTCDDRFAREVGGIPLTRNSKLLSMLKETLERRNITIDAITL